VNHSDVLSNDIKISNFNRIEWVDIFKALTIISVVLGHATGLYNMYIYQFHMAAFLFISGYTTRLENRSFFETIWDKFCIIILPLITIFIMMLGVLVCLNLLMPGYEWNRPFLNIDIKFIVTQFFLKGNMYISWLGATWFLNVLFGCCIIQKLLFNFSKNKVGILYILGSIIVFILGYYMVLSQENQYHSLDLIFIAQFYFFSGILFKHNNIFGNYMSNVYYNIIIILSTIVGLYYFSNINPNTVDYPSRRFGNILSNYFAALNGIIFIYLLSYYLSKFPIKIKQLLSYIGQNTICIVFFHFIFFKISFILLYFVDIIPLNYIQNFTPTSEIGNKYYFIFVMVSILLSLLIWKMLNQYKFMRILLGGEKAIYKNIYQRIRDIFYFISYMKSNKKL
jgi:fucose 4-O-acetylase-like acetyltransferase